MSADPSSGRCAVNAAPPRRWRLRGAGFSCWPPRA